jgi:hypothetical protein
MNEVLDSIANFEIGLFFKFAVVLLIVLYAIFSIVLYNHIRSLQRIVIIRNSFAHSIVQAFGLIYLLASCVLFILSLVIL